MTERAAIAEALSRLTAALPAGAVISDADALEKYSRDETPDLERAPDILVMASTASDVSTVMKMCAELGVPVIPRGAGTGVAGGAIPVTGGVTLSLERMDRVLEIDRENLVAVVEPGAITRVVQERALEAGLMYPPDPSSLDSCSIGGNVAVSAGGPRAVKYGTTKDYVIGMEFVLPTGEIIVTGGKFIKNATGYNLSALLTGSEGTLAVITKIFLRLIPAPPASIDLLIPFCDIGSALEAVHAITANKIVPTTIEFMEEDALRLVAEYLGEEMPFPLAKAHLLVQVDGPSEDDVYRQAELIVATLRLDGAEVIVASTREQRDTIWKARRAIREAITRKSPVFLAEDSVVPRAAVHDFLTTLKREFGARGLRSVMFGHAGDGNVHVDVLRFDMPESEWKPLVIELRKLIYETAVSFGGTISGEHGIGFTKKGYLPLAMTAAEMELMRRIKKAFDPRGILNPGKKVPPGG
ncbi:MAG TPA: FAD-linked oxidase C-terminal domain-containing protein [Spirochaetota bacterium]|nr:FAD-linked oxidase C-terminal domain-containing protein [Spirochaetota bacterium]